MHVDNKYIRSVYLFLFGLSLGAILSCSTQSEKKQKPAGLAKGVFNHLLVATSDYHSGELAWVNLLTAKTERLKVAIHSDAVVRQFLGDSFFYVVNRLGADNILWGDLVTQEVKGQHSVGRLSNPQDITVVNSEAAYVTRLASSKILKMNPRTGAVLKEIDPFANVDEKTAASSDSDGFPEFTWMRVWGNQLLIVMQRLATDEGYIPSNKSQIAILDLQKDSVEKIVTLAATNPVTEIKVWENNLAIGLAGKLGQLDGGIEMFDSELNSLGLITTEEKLGGDIIDCAILSKERGIAIVAKDIYSSKSKTQLVVFQLSDGRVVSTLKDPGTFSLHQLLVDPVRNIFYVADRDRSKPGIWVYSSETLEPLFLEKYDVGLPPYHMILVE